jgi:hypothetical protein
VPFSSPPTTLRATVEVFEPASTLGLTQPVKAMLRPTVSRPIWPAVRHPSGAHDQMYIPVRHLRVCWCGAPSLTRGRSYTLPLLLDLASAAILRSESHRTHDHCILLSQIWDSPNLRAGFSYYIPQEQGSPVIPPGLQKLLTQPQSQVKVRHVATDGQSVSMSWCRAPSGSHDQMFVTVWRLLLCLYGALSLTGGRVCRLSVRVCILSCLSVHIEVFTFRMFNIKIRVHTLYLRVLIGYVLVLSFER